MSNATHEALVGNLAAAAVLLDHEQSISAKRHKAAGASATDEVSQNHAAWLARRQHEFDVVRAAVLAAMEENARQREALLRLRKWGGLGGSYSATVAFGVTDWIDAGMKGDLPELPDYARAAITSSGSPT